MDLRETALALGAHYQAACGWVRQGRPAGRRQRSRRSWAGHQPL